MFDQSCLNEVLVQYKKEFISKHWPNEKYKWEAVKCFQDNWDINAVNFADMLSRSLAKTNNLLASANNFPAGMILGFAKTAPEEVRSMYIDLFDENQDVYERIDTFKKQSSILLEKYGNGARQHYQYENVITTYLWLRYPDKYYIYKYTEARSVSERLSSSYSFKKGAYAENLQNFYAFYNEICNVLKQDTELVTLFRSQLTESCYPDPELKTLTFDIGFYIYRNPLKKKGISSEDSEWHPSPEEYNPGITTSEWIGLLEDESVFTQSSLAVMKRIQDYGGSAAWSQLAVKYGEKKDFYHSESTELAKRVLKKTGCPVMAEDSDHPEWLAVLYVCKNAAKEEESGMIWKLRSELSDALRQVDLSHVDLYANKEDNKKTGYWWLNANPKIWSFSDLQVGDVQDYTLYNGNGNKRRIFQNFLDAKTGDLVIGYESNPVKQIVALAKVSTANDGQRIYFEKTESLANPIDYVTLKECQELAEMEFFQNPNGSLFRLTKEEYEFIMDMIREENPLSTEREIPSYTKKDFLSEVYMSEEKYDRLAGVLLNKMNIILQGAPGVGKTFAAKRLAYSLMGEKDDSRIEFVQFHQNYSYEDFMMGYKPAGDSFELKNGVFYTFCKKAESQPDKKHFFLIDEINRGNLSKIFGELLMLIEKDYRGTKATLAYTDMSFSVPDNLYIIGMMNTADRSLAMIDYALRRRFSFFEMDPAFESEGFTAYQKMLANETFDDLIQKVIELNDEIRRDKSLGKGFCIGHSYFCGRTKESCTDEWMQSIVDYDILPMLAEYWFDDGDKVQRWDNILHGIFQ